MLQVQLDPFCRRGRGPLSGIAIRLSAAHLGSMTVSLVPHDPRWTLAFATEAKAIEHALGPQLISVHHVGSTAIPGILAKPIIDMLGVVPNHTATDAATDILEGLGYQAMGAYDIEGRRYFRKADRSGTRTHHLHLYEDGSAHVARHIAFRDYVLAHPEVAAAYSRLKRELAGKGAASGAEYQDTKAAFVTRIEAQALKWVRRQ